jgi:hypothetical protein
MTKSNNEVKHNIGALVAVCLFIGTFVYMTIVMSVNDRIENDLKETRLVSERLLSEKLLQEKRNAELQRKYTSLESEFKRTSNILQNTLTALSQKEFELRSGKSNIKPLLIKKQREEIEQLRNKLKRDSLKSETEVTNLETESEGLRRSLAQKRDEEAVYSMQIEQLKRLRMNNVNVESLKRNKRLTTKASKTKIINVGMEVSDLVRDLTFSIVSPDGKQLVLNNQNSSLEIIENFDQKSIQFLKTRRVEITYRSSGRLQPGNYKIFLNSAAEPIGNLVFSLE